MRGASAWGWFCGAPPRRPRCPDSLLAPWVCLACGATLRLTREQGCRAMRECPACGCSSRGRQ